MYSNSDQWIVVEIVVNSNGKMRFYVLNGPGYKNTTKTHSITTF